MGKKTLPPTPLVKVDGMWKAKCSTKKCPRGLQNLAVFTPAVSNVTHKKRASFLKLLLGNGGALKEEEIGQIQTLRARKCDCCRKSEQKSRNKPSTKQGECKALVRKMQSEAREEGCALCGCNDALEFQHVDARSKILDKHGNTVGLAEYARWPMLGGPEAMLKEREKCIILCTNCHRMETANDSYWSLKSDDLANVSRKDNAPAYDKKKHLQIKEEKRQYVNSLKNNTGKCEECTAEVVQSTAECIPGKRYLPHCFDYAHISELSKGDEKGMFGTVAKLVYSGRNIKREKPNIDREIAKCRLLCACCHRVETNRRRRGVEFV